MAPSSPPTMQQQKKGCCCSASASRLLTIAYAIIGALTALFGGLCFGVWKETLELINDINSVKPHSGSEPCKSRISLRAWQHMLQSKAVSAGFVVVIAIGFFVVSFMVCCATVCGRGLNKPRSRFSRGFLSGAALIIAFFLANVSFEFQTMIPMSEELSESVDAANANTTTTFINETTTTVLLINNENNNQPVTQLNKALLYSAVVSGYLAAFCYLLLSISLRLLVSEDKTVALRNELGEIVEVSAR
ncbi:hypothetical protein PPROV_000135500 [Pycnococcus provasolii]|uniref:Transmembrane protein n=1 Tax=Pycnococcus provasolii TaxID=41880 RepID=A0A830HB21_9CHLO|nr:hypothetical protein PPROV_000135500 [Pycnococcus provasolii]|mmetsp:Transcript_7937/g.18113  ORF Transcript_7937/g.18113 Transcript_7937/m.18113 type:complete len:247 (+) Transcript_7937:40-780(+)